MTSSPRSKPPPIIVQPHPSAPAPSGGAGSSGPHSGSSSGARSPQQAHTPGSAIISIPPGWASSTDSPIGGSGGRSSWDSHLSQQHYYPISASSSSSSSQPIFSWPPPRASSSRNPTPGHSHPPQDRFDPFDTTNSFSDDPFAARSGSSSSGEDDRRSSRQSSFTDPIDFASSAFVDPTPPPVSSALGSGPGPGPGSGWDDARRGSITMIPHHLRSHTDSHLHEGQPLDAEFSGLGLPESYHFDPAAPPAPPAFVRTFSAPLPHRVGYLRHPLSPSDDPLASYSAHPARQMSSFSALGHDPQYRPPPRSNSSDQSSATRVDSTPGETESPLQTLSLELADSVQTAIQTLLHLSPPHLLDNAKEQYSGCTVQMPTTSLSALLSSMRSLNYLSANLQALCEPGKAAAGGTEEGLLAAAASTRREDFDIGELLQTVADLLSGHAAQAGVDLVLFHGDASIKHISVTGDGEGLGYMLSHIIRQILLVAHQGDTIELGLQIVPQSPSMTPRVSLPLTASEVEQRRASGGSAVRSASPGRTLPSPPSGHLDGPLLCVFEIVHNVAQAPDSATATPKAELNPFTHLTEQKEAAQPKLDSLLCRRLLQHQHANLKVDAQPSSPLGSGLPRRAYEVSVLLPRGKPILETPSLTVEEEAVRQPFPSVQLAREPTLAELSSFQDSLKGKKVFLHASLSSLFARHLTSYLAAWGLDIYHIPIEESDDNVFQDRSGIRSAPQDGGEVGAPASNELASSMADMSLNQEPKSSASGETEKFIIIDDDVQVLRRELLRLRSENGALALKPRLTKRPTLTSRARSTPHVRQISTAPKSPSVVLIHFTSLAKYNQVRDVVSTFLGSPTFSPSGALVHPEIMVVPKPVGPRRFLTALHTAVNQPVVDPFFAPIATSPRSPGGGFLVGSNRTPLGSELGASGGFFDSVAEESGEGDRPRPASESSGSQKARSPLGEYPPAQATIVRTDHGLHLSLPTPGEILATPASEYFSNATTKAGSSGASGVVMQSPDGRPFGMFFEPPVKNERRMSVARMSSDSVRRRGPPSRRTSAGMVLDEAHGGVGKTSPQGSRRASTLSGGAEDKSLSRRSSGRTEPLVKEDRVARAAGRRKTLPANGEPIIAKGRERSSTITQSSIWRKPGSGTVSPLLTSPKDEDPPTIPLQSSFHPPKARKQAAVPEVEDTHRLPGAPTGDVPGSKKSKEDVVVPPINVLIVEDNPINQNILSMFLRKKKIKHQSAKDGLEAVEKWRTGGFHLILMDIQLPVMDGIAATKEIRKLERSNNIGVFPSTPASEQPQSALATPKDSSGSGPTEPPASPFRSSVIIVALTASSLQSDRVVALAAGCNDFLTKPVSLKWLERKIVEWGCMQALIDFDGWRRWKSFDPKDGHDAGETKRGFQVGPQAAARHLASRLKIDRKPGRSPSGTTRSDSASTGTGSDFEPPSSLAPGPAGPEITVSSATPPPDLVLGKVLPQSQGGAAIGAGDRVGPISADPFDLDKAAATESLELARRDLNRSLSDSDEMRPSESSPPIEVIATPGPIQALQAIVEAKESPLVMEKKLPILNTRLDGGLEADAEVPGLGGEGGADDGPEPNSDSSGNEVSPIGQERI